MFRKNRFKEAERIESEVDRICEKLEKGKLKSREVRGVRSLSKIEKELATKIARILASYCKEEDEECEIYIRAVLLKYRPEDVVRFIENVLTENKSLIVELKKLVSDQDVERARNIGGFRILSKFFKKTSRENIE